MFDNLTNKFSSILRNISSRGRLTENNIKETLREIRIALLEADVALPVISEFIKLIKKEAIGQDINKNLTPGQEFVKIVQKKLTKLIEGVSGVLDLESQKPSVIFVVGLPGSGKTTTVVKLGKLLKYQKKKKVLVTSIDVYRPAAIKQLEVLTKIANIDFFASKSHDKPITIAVNALQHTKIELYDVLIVDTTGYLHIDEFMMKEIQTVHNAINPIETLFVVDAMVGQDIAHASKIFNEKLLLTGVILTKIDSDTRGGAALSIQYITGKPIKFLGIGEKINDLEIFYAERISSRILGMGDTLSFIQAIENKLNNKKIKNIAYKFKNSNSFNLNDFLDQLKYMRSIGGITALLNKIPSVLQCFNFIESDINNKTLIRMEAIIRSMTNKERENPEIIKGSRKRRIALGSGTQVQHVNKLLKQFYDMKHIIKNVKKGGLYKLICKIKMLNNFYSN
ncbi:Signal recognition particle protein [Candidatus Arsenophonus lipoptenae]|uniref:signal-recognition-particle GTPase n=1 Tax=Candidatus Arsenophonus lipoptenae TaxID=634113 RepID=A0A0X9W364_9GAMM|nr:signal recognition particle protein [Candidatus Arsenophonus lipoptenae]AMA64954.1 Signal recognition particle protein [Candidatus Arsenophonus lipoptenae]